MKYCGDCGNKAALFNTKDNRKVRADKRHDLCFKCAKAYINRLRIKPQAA